MFLLQIASEHQSEYDRHSDSHCQPQLGSHLAAGVDISGVSGSLCASKDLVHTWQACCFCRDMLPGLWTEQFSPGGMWAAPCAVTPGEPELWPGADHFSQHPGCFTEGSGGREPHCLQQQPHGPPFMLRLWFTPRLILTPASQDHLPNKPCKYNLLFQLLLFSGES